MTTLRFSALFLAILWLSATCGIGQNDDDDLDALVNQLLSNRPALVLGTFSTTILVNNQTHEQLGKGTIDFRVTHRFGQMLGDAGGYHTYFGLDNSSDIRIGLDWGILDRLMVGVGRSKAGQRYDLRAKYAVLQQKTLGMPISLSVYGNTSVVTPQEVTDQYGVDRYGNFRDRLTYVAQAIVARKLSRHLSVMVSPTVIHRNYTSDYYWLNEGQATGPLTAESQLVRDGNTHFAVAAGLRVRVSPSMCLTADYTHIFSEFRTNHPVRSFYMPLGIGLEYEVGGHVFQINLTNNRGIVEADYLANTETGWGDGSFRLGFNISRIFMLGQRITKAPEIK